MTEDNLDILVLQILFKSESSGYVEMTSKEHTMVMFTFSKYMNSFKHKEDIYIPSGFEQLHTHLKEKEIKQQKIKEILK